jgi:predicted enzyme involved in methoxymalonyl-ACP biosynthesis
MNLFATDTVKKNSIEYINEYLQNFETDLAMEEKDFMASYNVHKVFDLIKKSDVFKVYTKNL